MKRKYRSYFATCDHCNKKFEYRDNYKKQHRPVRVEREINGFAIEITVGHRGAWNTCDLCPACIVGVIQNSTAKPTAHYSPGYVFVTDTVYMHEHEYLVRSLRGDQLTSWQPGRILSNNG